MMIPERELEFEPELDEIRPSGTLSVDAEPTLVIRAAESKDQSIDMSSSLSCTTPTTAQEEYEFSST